MSGSVRRVFGRIVTGCMFSFPARFTRTLKKQELPSCRCIMCSRVLMNRERSSVARMKRVQKELAIQSRFHSYAFGRSRTNTNQVLVDCAIRRARNNEVTEFPQSRIPVPTEVEIAIISA